jgi:urease accessory protein
VPGDDARRLHLFCLLRDQVSAAIRLGLVGPAEGHELQASLFGHCERLQRRSAERRHRDAWRCAPLIDLAQASHSRLYSRLFQN